MDTIKNISWDCLKTLFIKSINVVKALVKVNKINKKIIQTTPGCKSYFKNIIFFHPESMITRPKVNSTNKFLLIIGQTNCLFLIEDNYS